MRCAAVILALVTLAAATAGAGQDAPAGMDPFVGTWRLDPEQCRYESGPPPLEMVIVMEQAGNGIHYRSRTVYPGGGTSTTEYTADYDEVPVLVTGTSGLSVPVSVKRIDPWTAEAIYSRAFRVMASSRRVVDRQGSTLTITTRVHNEDATVATNIGVYRRV